MNRNLHSTSRQVIESLEPRQMLCVMHTAGESAAGTDLYAGYGFGGPLPIVSEPANIVWINRANTVAGGPNDTDGFGAIFGTTAPKARAIVDAMIVQYERMIGSFNYPVAGEFYSLTVNMGSPFGTFSGGAGIQFPLLGGKPHAGTIGMGVGIVNADPNDDNGWFLDPTPFDSSEFRGPFWNAFTGTAHPGSPAENRYDFFSYLAAEMTHNLGLYGDLVPGWHALTTDTGMPDQTNGGTGNLWVFRGPSIKHLVTSNQGGIWGMDTGVAVHSAGYLDSIAFEGDEYEGNLDQGTAMSGTGNRFMVNQTFALMFKDALGYDTVNPAQFSTGTMYSTLDQTTGQLYVRGAEGQLSFSTIPVGAEKFSITRSGNTIAVSVDPYYDSPASGALPGEGNLPPWVTYYDASQLSSITIDGASLSDQITISANLGVPVSLIPDPGMPDKLIIEGTDGDDSVGLTASGASLNNGVPFQCSFVSEFVFHAGAGKDSLVLNTSLGQQFPVSVDFDGGANWDQVYVRGLPGADSVNFTGGNITWPWTTVATTSSERTGFDGSLGGDFVNLLDGATVHLQNAQYFAELVIGDDCTMVANPTISNDPSLSYLIRADLLNVFDGWLDLNNNDLLVDSPNVPFWYVRNLVASGRNGGDWLGTGITSTMARNHPDQSTTLGVMDAADWHALAGPNALFDGAPVDQDAVLVKYTWYGDTDFNGVVDFDDYVHADQGHNNGWSGWTNGDFDLNGQVDFDDYVFLDMGFNKQGELL